MGHGAQYRWAGPHVKGGKQSYVPFTVRDDARPSHFMFKAAVATWQA